MLPYQHSNPNVVPEQSIPQHQSGMRNFSSSQPNSGPSSSAIASGIFVPLAGGATRPSHSFVPQPQCSTSPQQLGRPRPLYVSRHPGGTQQPGSRPVAPGPAYSTTPRGEKYPLDLAPYLQQGVPLKISRVCEDSNIQFFASKFPEGFDLSDLKHPLSIQRDVSQVEIAEDATGSMLVGEDTRPINFRGSNNREPRRPRKIDPTRLPWRLIDQNKKNLIGRRTDLDTSNYFVMVDKGDCIELVPLDGWYTYHTDLHSNGSAEPPSTDLAERKRRNALKLEEKAAAKMASRIVKDSDGSEDEFDIVKKRKSGNDTIDSLYAEDGGLKRQQNKKLKSIIKSKKRGMKRDDEDVGDSALNLGELKRHEVDWDWEEDGKATDDEEDIAEEHDEAEDGKNDFNESDDEEQSALTKFGQQVNSALESQKEHDADDELAQFSDDGEDDDKEKKDEQETGNGKKVRDEMSSVSSRSVLKSSTSVGKGTSSNKFSEQPRASGGAKSVVSSSSGKDEPLSAESVKQRVVRMLSLHGGRMPTKQFISTLNITSNKSDLFKFVRKSINEVCEVHTETINGESVKILELLSWDYYQRPTHANAETQNRNTGPMESKLGGEFRIYDKSRNAVDIKGNTPTSNSEGDACSSDTHGDGYLVEITIHKYEHLLRWMGYRAVRRSRFLNLKIDGWTRLWAILCFLLTTTFILAGWIFKLESWLHFQVSYWTNGWGFVLAHPVDQHINYSLLLPFGIFSTIAFLSHLHVDSSDNFISISMFLSKISFGTCVVLLAIEVLFVYPLCWATFLRTDLKKFCESEHDYTWKTLGLTFVSLQALFGIVFGTYTTIISLATWILYAAFPLCCIVGPQFCIKQFKPIQCFFDLSNALKAIQPLAPDTRIVRLIEETLTSQEKGIFNENSFRDGRTASTEFAFISFELRTFYRLLQICFCWWHDSTLLHQFDAMYLGQINENKEPDGIGLWIDLRPNGEILYGCWTCGIPRGPFESFSRCLNSTFSASRIAFAYPSTADNEVMSFGTADVETCLSSLPLMEFPSVLSIRKTRKSTACHSHRASIDIELSLPETMRLNLCRPLTTETTPILRASLSMETTNNNSVEEQECLVKLKTERPIKMIDINNSLVECLSYGLEAFNSRLPKVINSKEKPQSLSTLKQIKKCLVVLCPSYWSFKQGLHSVGSMAALFGNHSEFPILLLSQQRPITQFQDWLHWLLRPLKFSRNVTYVTPNLSIVLEELHQLACSDIDILSVGDGSKLLFNVVSECKLYNFHSISMIFPYFNNSITQSIAHCRKLSPSVTIYGSGDTTTSSLYRSYDAISFSVYQIRQGTFQLENTQSETLPFLSKNGKLGLQEDVDIINVDSLLGVVPGGVRCRNRTSYSILHCLNQIGSCFLNTFLMQSNPKAKNALQDNNIVEDLSRAHHRYPRLRQSAEGVWTFQRTQQTQLFAS